MSCVQCLGFQPLGAASWSPVRVGSSCPKDHVDLQALLLSLHLESLEQEPCCISHICILQPVIGPPSQQEAACFHSLMEGGRRFSARICPAALGGSGSEREVRMPLTGTSGPSLLCVPGAKCKKGGRFSSLLYPWCFCSPGNEVSRGKCNLPLRMSKWLTGCSRR